MAYDHLNGIPILGQKSLLSDVPAYTEALVQSLATILPIGLIQPFAGEFNQSSMGCWRLCDGLEVPDVSEYAALRTLLYNAHSSYNTPDLRGRAPIGMGQETGVPDHNPENYDTLLEKYGDERIPKHDHGVTDLGHSHHAMSAIGSSSEMASWTVGGAQHLHSGGAPFGYTSSNPSQISIQYSGAGGSNNVPPSLAVNFIILAAYRSPATP